MGAADALAVAAVAGIRSGMMVGLGTGRAATRGIRALAERAKAERLDLRCVATSKASADLATQLGLRVEPMEGVEVVDYLFDGADEVDPQLRMIKGRGGAMTREKIVAQASSHRVYLVQTEKRVQRLGEKAPLPIEVLQFGLASIRRALAELGLKGVLRLAESGGVYQTDNGNPVLDAPIPAGLAPERLATALDALSGVVGHGLFLDEADVVLSEDAQGKVTSQARPGSPRVRKP
jgi:ribose 5-phosphate isomerase A